MISQLTLNSYDFHLLSENIKFQKIIADDFFTVCSFVVIFQLWRFKWPSNVFLMITCELLIENDSFPVSLNLMTFPVLRVMFLALCSLVDVSVVFCKMWSCDKSTCVVLFLGNLLHFSSLGFLPASYIMYVYCLMTRCHAKNFRSSEMSYAVVFNQ